MCSISRLQPNEGQGVVRRQDGSLGFTSLTRQLYIVNVSEYTYVGNDSIFGDIILDKWQYVGNIETPQASYYNITVDLGIARGGMPSLSLNSSGPVPWKISVNGIESINDGNVTISSLTRFFDVSFEKPRYDVFDVSMCSPPGDHEVVVVSVPKDSAAESAVDLDMFMTNVRTSVMDYTGLAPIQVGNIRVR